MILSDTVNSDAGISAVPQRMATNRPIRRDLSSEDASAEAREKARLRHGLSSLLSDSTHPALARLDGEGLESLAESWLKSTIEPTDNIASEERALVHETGSPTQPVPRSGSHRTHTPSSSQVSQPQYSQPRNKRRLSDESSGTCTVASKDTQALTRVSRLTTRRPQEEKKAQEVCPWHVQ